MPSAEDAIAALEAAEDGDFVGPRPPALVDAAEAALGLRFPPSYRLFLERLGTGSAGDVEVYGVVDEPFDGPVPDAVWATLQSREAPEPLPPTMIVIGDDGMGGDYVLDTAKGAEPPVEVWMGGLTEVVAEDFPSFVLDAL